MVVTSFRTGRAQWDLSPGVSTGSLSHTAAGLWQLASCNAGERLGWTGDQGDPHGVSNPERELSAQRDSEDELGALSSPTPSHLISSLFSHLSQGMSLVTTLFLLLLAVQPVLKVDSSKDMAIARKMLEREVYLREEMIRLIQELEETTAEDTLLSTLHWQCLFWTTLVALVLVTVVLWPARPGMLHEPPQLFKAHCSGVPQDVSTFEIKLIFGEQKASTGSKCHQRPLVCDSLNHLCTFTRLNRFVQSQKAQVSMW